MTAGALRIAMSSYYLPSESKIGAGYMAHRLAEVMQARGHSVTMFSPCRKPEGATYEHRVVPMTGSLRTFRWGYRLRRLDLEAFDVLHAHGDNHLRMPWSRPAVVRTMHGSCLSEALRIKGPKERLRMLLLGATEVVGSLTATEVVAVSNNTRFFYPWITRVIPNGVDLARFCPGQKADVPTVLFVGTYERRKRGRLLMEAFERSVRPALANAQLWMVCSDAPVAPQVQVLGVLSDEELAERYRSAWVFCLPSKYEGFGVPYLEAMASGTTVVATGNPGANEVLDDGNLGVICGDEELGATLVRLLGSSAEREELERRALDAAQRYDWAVIAERYEAVYRDALRRPRR